MNRVDEIQARVAAATPGPWEALEDAPGLWGAWRHDSVNEPPMGGECNREVAVQGLDGTPADLALIAHAPDDLAYLLAQLHGRALEVSRLRGVLSGVADVLASQGLTLLANSVRAHVEPSPKVAAVHRAAERVHLFHRTTASAAQAILDEGFRDAGSTCDTAFVGLLLSDSPVGAALKFESARGPVLLRLRFGFDDLAELAEFEVEDAAAKSYREWFVPLAVLRDWVIAVEVAGE